MRKVLFFILLSLSSLAAVASNYLTQKERENIQETFRRLDYYHDVPNYINCNTQKTTLEKMVCGNKDLLKMFHLLSIANVFAWENATKREVDHLTFNRTNMQNWTDRYIVNTAALCFDIKQATNDLLGGISPYKILELKGELEGAFALQENEHGIILSNRTGYKIYLGKSYDVIDTNKKRGHWYKENNIYFITLNESETTFYYNENE